MRWIVWLMLVVLVVLHQDFWQFDDGTIWFGFLPYGLAYHIVLSLAATGIWSLAVKFCWPAGLVDSTSTKSEST
jgi:hypothetical protein